MPKILKTCLEYIYLKKKYTVQIPDFTRGNRVTPGQLVSQGTWIWTKLLKSNNQGPWFRFLILANNRGPWFRFPVLANNREPEPDLHPYIFLGSNLISWLGKKQHVVPRSSTEAEYQSMSLETADLFQLRMLLCELHICLCSPHIFWCVNAGAIALASNPVFHARTKHIEVDIHFIREKLTNRSIQIRYIFTFGPNCRPLHHRAQCHSFLPAT